MAKKTRKELLIERTRALLAMDRKQKGIVGVRPLTKRERTKHFDMNAYGYQSECGTVCCLAGHAGFQPWFRRRGMKSVFEGGIVSIHVKGSSEFFVNDRMNEWFGLGAHRAMFHAHLSSDWTEAMQRVRQRIADIEAMTEEEAARL